MTPPPDLKPPKILTWLVFIAAVNAVILLALLLPFAPGVSLTVVGVLVGMLVIARRTRLDLRRALGITLRGLRGAALGRSPTAEADSAKRAPGKPPAWLIAAEIVLIVVAALWATGYDRYLDQPVPRLRGWESEWLTSSATFAAQSLREYGYIPKWQPYLEFGEPLIYSPFSFIANPISAGPSLLFGALEGIQISVVLYAILAGVGGWFLGRVLGLGTLGRVLLGLLILGKGNMHAMIATGYFQLGVTQAYIPWVIGGTLAILWKPDKRWPVILTALMFALMFTAGNVWYTLPTLFTMLLLVVMYAVIIPGKIDWHALKRLALAGLLTVGLSAVTLLPIALESDHIGGHPNEIRAGAKVVPEEVIPLYFNGDYERVLHITSAVIGHHEPPVGHVQQFYYTYVVPLWFLNLIIFTIPPIWPVLHRSGQPGSQGIWIVGAVMIVLATAWSVGETPLFLWLYEHIPFLGQWRFVGRALAVGSFWIAVLVALRLDGLWRALIRLTPRWKKDRPLPLTLWTGAATLALAGFAGLAAYQVNARWGYSNYGDPAVYKDDVCVTWLRQNHPDEQLAVYRSGYDAITTFIRNRVRMFNIAADYSPIPQRWTYGTIDLLGYASLPAYGIPWDDDVRAFFRENSYTPIANGLLFDQRLCLWHKADALSYAYTIPMRNVDALQDEVFDASYTTPVTRFAHWPDEIGLLVPGDPDESLILTVQELAYPGWRVEVDGESAKLESIGGLIGVVLPPGETVYRVDFAFRPRLYYASAWITLLTCAFCAGYLLRGERLFWQVVKKRPG